jgi:hypothetical protein
MNLFHFKVPIVESVTQMSGRPASLPAPGHPIIESDDLAANFRQFISYGQSRNSCSHDADVGLDIFV